MENDLQQLNNVDGDVQTVDNGETATSPQRKKLNKFVDVLLWVLIAVLAIAVIVRAFLLTQITVSGESMMETYRDKDVVAVSKVKTLKRGDVVIFYKQDGTNKFLDIFSSGKSGDDSEHAKLIKRVVATAGDKLWVEKVSDDGDWYFVVVETVDGDIIHEDGYKHKKEVLAKENFYIKGTLSNGSGLGILSQHIGQANALEIPKDCFFAMGDNRSNSSDSRAFGAVPLSRLYGVVINS